MKKYSILLLTTLAIFAAILFVPGCQTTNKTATAKMLKFNLEKNKGYDYELIMNMDQEIMGQELKMDMTYYYSMDVESEEADIKTITSSIDRFKLKTGAMGFTIDVDTDRPYTEDTTAIGKSLGSVNKLFAAIKGRKFTMKVNSEGKIMSVTGFENMGQSIADSLNLDAEDRDEMLKEFNGQINADEMTQSLERFWYIFPNKEVKVGESWNKTVKMGGKMPGTYKSTYKVTDIEGDMVTVDETSQIEADEKDEVGMNGTITGTMVIDSRSGLVVSADQDMKIKATAKGMSFDIKAKTKLKGKAR